MATFQQPPPAYSTVEQQQQPMRMKTFAHSTPKHPATVLTVPQSNPQQFCTATIVIKGPQGDCSHCRVGNLVPKRDTFWLVVLLLLALLTFPLGIVFCCLIPFCTWNLECQNCHRRS